VRKMAVLFLLAMALSFSCSSSDEGSAKDWRCYVSYTDEGAYCECRFAEPGKHSDENEAAFDMTTCPRTSYKCCETRTMADSWNGRETCVCWNPEAIPACRGRDPIVSACPPQ